MIIDNYSWSNRLLIMITDRGENQLEKCVKEFFAQYEFEIKERKLKLLHFFVNELPIKELPPVMHTKKGIWLIGYDGSIKAYSEDTRLLISLFELIDSMPMRREEISCKLAGG